MLFNSGPKPKENHESWESLFRQTLSKERLFTLTRPAENPIHWIQFLDPFDQQDTRNVCKSTVTHSDSAAKVSGESRAGCLMDVPGWPLTPFSKVRMFKCEKCCLEFCSPMNHRRHLRMIHRRPLHAEKEDLKSLRQQFATFWDKLSPEEAYKIAAVKNLQLEELTGEKVARALTHLLQQPSLFALPHSYVKSGAMLLELVQSRSPRLHLTSSELFRILDGSSEKTFPSFGLNAMQRYIFEGGAGKVGLETKNLVASLSFLVEHNLVKAFIKDKDEEAWRCQNALVEEEEASQRKQAQIQARKRMKKFRQKDKEQKASDSAMRLLSDSDTSDDEISSISKPGGLQARPSSNTFENLNHKLAGEGSDFDHRLEVVSTAVSSPSNKSLVLGDSDDMVSIADEVDGEAKDSSSLPATNEGSPPNASGVQNPYNYQKCKYPAERSLSFRGEVSPFPYQKQSWKEKRSLSAKNICKQISANELEESSSRAIVRDPSANQVAGSRPMQYVAKPVRLRNYQTAAQIGAAVWTKKMLKCADAASAKIPELANNIRPDVSDSGLQADGSFDSSVGVAAPHDRKAGSLFITSTLVCPSIEPPPSSTTSKEEVNVSLGKSGFCNHESSSSALSVADSWHYDEPGGGHNSASIVPVVIGSMVIGSVSVSLDSVVGQIESALTVSSCKDETQASKVVDASERELAKLVDPAERPKETNGALHENGVISYAPHKEAKGDGKSLKILLQSDGKWKENKEHSISQARIGNFIKPTVVQGGSFAGAKMKVWRPVVSNTSQDCCVEKLSALDINSPDSLNNVASNQSPVIGGDINDLGVKELEIGQTIQGNSSLTYSVASAEVIKDGSAPESSCTSTFKAVSCFLSQRWSEALNTLDSVILSVEDEEGCATQGCDNIVDGQSRDTNVYSKDSRNPSPQLHKEVNNLPGNDNKKIRGLWNQGCSGSAMAVNRRLTGKDNLHFTSRFTGYRYVPK